MKKILSLVLVLVLVLGSMPLAFADEATPTAGETLQAYGLVTGMDAEGNLGEDVQVTRAMMIKLLETLLGEEEAASTFALPSTFTDVPADAWYAPYVAYAELMGYTNGMGDGTFAPDALVSKQMVATYLLRALGYEVTAENYATAEADALALGIDVTPAAAEMTRGEAFDMMLDALAVPTKDSEVTLGAKLEIADFTTPVVVVPETLEVVSVEATNLRTVEITFNMDMTANEEADVASNYKFDSNAAAKAIVDGEKVTVTVADANALGNYSSKDVEISKELGFDEDLVVKNVSFKDTTVPSILSVEATGPRTLKVTFSEVLEDDAADALTGVKLNDGTVALDTASSIVYSTNEPTATIKTLADLSEGLNTLNIGTTNVMVDNAGYSLQAADIAFDYVADTSELTATITDSSETFVEITFNKALKSGTFMGNDNVYITHTYDTATNEILGNNVNVTNPDGDDQTFKVVFDNPIPPNGVNVWVGYVDTDAKLIEDGYGNEFAAAVYTVSVTSDTTNPTATVEFKDSNEVRVTYSEDMDQTVAETTSNYTLKDADGDKVNITNAVYNAADDYVTLTTATIEGGEMTLEVKNQKDTSVAGNKLGTQVYTFTATDKVEPTVTDKSAAAGIQVYGVSTDKVRVDFSEAMDITTTTDKDNWYFNGSALADDDTVEAINGNKSVIITRDAADVTASDTVTMGRVKDAAGNWINSISTSLVVIDAVQIVPKTVTAISTTQIEMLFEDEIITGALIADFEVDNDNAGYDAVIVGISTSVDAGDTTITLTLQDDATNSIADYTAAVVKVRSAGGAATTGAMNEYDITLTFTETTVVDSISPNYVGSVTDDTDANGKIDAIVATFSEDIYVASVTEADFSVEGYTIDSVSVSGAEVTLVLEEGSEADTDATPEVELVGAVEDTERNVLDGDTAADAVDAAAPVLLTVVNEAATISTDDVLTFTFSEAVAILANLDDVNSYTVTTAGAGSIKTDTGAVNTDEVGTLMINDATWANSDSIALVAASFADAAGNNLNAAADTVTFTDVTGANVAANNTIN